MSKKLSDRLKGMWVVRHPFKAFSLSIFALVLIVFGFLLWVSNALLREPLCDDWHRGMTKEEKIFLAVEVANQENSLRFEKYDPDSKKIYFDMGRLIPYEGGAEQILREQPDCCKLYASYTARTDHPSEDVAENDEGTVYMNYIGKYKGVNGAVHSARVSEYGNYNFCTD